MPGHIHVACLDSAWYECWLAITSWIGPLRWQTSHNYYVIIIVDGPKSVQCHWIHFLLFLLLLSILCIRLCCEVRGGAKLFGITVCPWVRLASTRWSISNTCWYLLLTCLSLTSCCWVYLNQVRGSWHIAFQLRRLKCQAIFTHRVFWQCVICSADWL